MKSFTSLVLVVGLVVALNAAPKPTTSSTGVSMVAKNWTIQYSALMPKNPIALTPNSWYFNFPLAPGHVNYITTAYKTPIPVGSWLIFTATIDTTGTPTFIHDNDASTYPVYLRPYIEQGNLVGRFWANPPLALGPLHAGTYQVTVPFTPEYWWNVNGKRGDSPEAGNGSEFADTLAHVGRVGLTCGGSFAGHGCHIDTGSARFTLLNYSIQ